jgi:hypothetical protein
VVPADPSPVPARDDAPDDVKAPLFVYAFVNADTGRPVAACFSRPLAFEADAMSRYAGVPVRIIACAAVPSPDVLRAECEALEWATDALTEPIYHARRLDHYPRHCEIAERLERTNDTLRAMLQRMRSLLAAVTRDGDAKGGTTR